MRIILFLFDRMFPQQLVYNPRLDILDNPWGEAAWQLLMHKHGSGLL